ncbi:uncharacterized protein METZ01_LOCUS122204, partial [marine metagenome]
MDRTFRSGLSLLIGIGFLFAALVMHSILLDRVAWTLLLSLIGFGFFTVGAISLRKELSSIFQRRRAEIVLFTAGLIGIYVSLGYFSIVYPLRFDMTAAGLHSLSDQTVSMLQRLEQPVHVVFFHSHQMGETVERYELMA